jgi:hypothetical protein
MVTEIVRVRTNANAIAALQPRSGGISVAQRVSVGIYRRSTKEAEPRSGDIRLTLYHRRNVYCGEGVIFFLIPCGWLRTAKVSA